MGNIEELVGKTLANIDGLEVGSRKVTFTCSDGIEFIFYHEQDCCETVSVEDIDGDILDLIANPILSASEEISRENPPDMIDDPYQDSFTWTFYKIATIKGTITIRWYGESNGFYSEKVYFEQVKD